MTQETRTTLLHPKLQRRFAVAWLVFMGLSFLFWLMKFASGYTDALNVSPELAQLLTEINLPPTFPALFKIFLDALMMGIVVFIGALIFLRRGNDWLALFTATTLYLTTIGYSGGRVNDYAFWMLVSTTYMALMETAQVLFFYIFPSGRFVPRVARWAVLPFFIFRWLIWLNIYTNDVPQGAIEVGFVILLLLIGIGFQVYRYRKTATPSQRQQVKWVLVGFTLTIALVAPSIYLLSIIPLAESGLNYLTYNIVLILRTIALFIAPLSLGFSVLRYRLWDIDLTLNRSLVAALITVLLAGVFGGILLVVNAVFNQLFSGNTSTIGIIVASIITGVAFNPTRQWVRNVVDRRLYGFRFDLNELKRSEQALIIKRKGLLSGEQLDGYHMLDLLGRGGMGEVYKATDDTRIVAVKTLPTELSTPEANARFARETTALQQLQHPNIVRFYGANLQHALTPYLVIEFVEGEDLSAFLKQEKKLSLETSLEIVKPLASALAHAHERGLVHRDVKPSNVMLRPNDDNETFTPILMDFGVVKLKEASGTLTGTGAVGTINYMSPEQIQQSTRVNYQADIYALGIMWYEMLTGRIPFEGGPGQILFAHIQQPPPDPRKFEPNIPEKYAYTILRALSKDPKDRFQSILDMVE